MKLYKVQLVDGSEINIDVVESERQSDSIVWVNGRRNRWKSTGKVFCKTERDALIEAIGMLDNVIEFAKEEIKHYNDVFEKASKGITEMRAKL